VYVCKGSPQRDGRIGGYWVPVPVTYACRIAGERLGEGAAAGGWTLSVTPTAWAKRLFAELPDFCSTLSNAV
jgi:hypothetical protein